MAVQTPDVAARVAPIKTRAPRLREVQLWVSGILLVVIVFACLLGRVVFRLPKPNAGELSDALKSPGTPGHLLGTDQLGNDLLSRLLAGGRISIEVSLAAVALSLVVGGAIGIIAAFKGGALDAVVMRLVEVIMAFPALVLAVSIATFLGPSQRNETIAIAVSMLPAFARLARSAALGLRDQPFIVAARLSGRRDPAILIRHLAPNVLPQMVTYSFLTLADVVIIEAGLSFLGAGVRPPQASWGSMIVQGQNYLYTNAYLLIVPCVALFVTILAVNLFGDALRAKWVNG